MSDPVDAVFIGGGLNALAGALHLASNGWRVAVFEQSATAGGAVKNGQYTAPNFRHDWAAMNLSLFAGSQFFKDYGKTLGQFGCEFVPISHPFASSFPDGRWAGVSTDLAQTLASIGALSAPDAEAWRSMTLQFESQAPLLFGLLGTKMHFNAFASLLYRIWRAKGISGGLEMARFLLSSPRDWLEAQFSHPHIRAMLGAWGMHLDFAPDIAGGAIFPYLEGMAGQAFGMVIGKGGADTITRALVAAIEAKGGTVHLGAAVRNILHENGKATGITLETGQIILAKRAVIAGVAPSGLAKLAGPIDPKFDAGLAKFRHAPGTMMIHLALRDLPNWRAGAALKSFAYVHIAPSLDQMARTYAQAAAGLLPDEPVLVVGQPTVFDPSRAPEGQHVLWVQVRMAPGQILGDAKGEISAKDWPSAAEAFAGRALDILERHAPGTRANIIAHRIVSPMDLAADNPNLVGGDQICGSHHLAQNFLFRPIKGHADGSTPLTNLHLTGAAVWPGAGTGAGAGYLLAQKLAGK